MSPSIPYYAVIFTSVRNKSAASTGYYETDARMEELATQSPGYIGYDSQSKTLEDGRVESLFISYWSDEESIKGWKGQIEHVQARAKGKKLWYDSWNVKVAKVEREVR